jgi:hypothetical protein
MQLDELMLHFPDGVPTLCWGLRIDDEAKAQGRQRDGAWVAFPELYELWSACGQEGVTVEIPTPLGYCVGGHEWRGAPKGAKLWLRAEPSPLAKLIVAEETSAYYSIGLWWYPDQTEPGSHLELGSLSEVLVAVKPGRLHRESPLSE